MSFLQCGSAVHYYRFRPGAPKDPVLVCINGLGTDQRIWDALFEALPPELSVLRYDLRGQGLSEGGQGRYDVATLSSDLELLLERIGAASVVPLGFSLGGLVAQQFALAHPARVRGLVLCATGSRIGSAEMWAARAEQVRQGGLTSIAESVLERWFSRAFAERRPEIVRAFRSLLERSDVASYLSALELLAQTDLSATLGQLSVPTLVVAGTADLAAPPERVRELADRIAGARLRVLAGAGHLLGVEQPEALAQCITDFLSHSGLWRGAPSVPALEPSAVPSAEQESRWARGMHVRRAVLGDAHVERSLAAATDFDRDFQDYITRAAWGEIWTRPGLPVHTRQLLTIVMLAALNRQEELALHLQATRNTGLSLEQVREALMQVAVYAGVPAAHAAIRLAQRVLFPPSAPDAARESEAGQHG
jgi:3-oxoadipate enol-lactonase / 4-carboxymuconolactone decarboxylase